MPTDKLIAATLKDAEKHREHFQTLVRENESMNADIKGHKADLDARLNAVSAKEAQQANTAAAQAKREHDLDERDAEYRKAQATLARERSAFDEEAVTLRKKQKARDEELDGLERDLTSRETTLTKDRSSFDEKTAETRTSLDEQATVLRTRQERLDQDAADLAEREKTYEAETRERLTSEIFGKLGK